MPVVLALVTSALFGTSDFCGGLAAKRAQLIQVVAGGHVLGLAGIFVVAVLVADEFRLDDFLLGAAGGAFGGVGIALLYRRLSIGPMNVVAPITALLSASVPAFWGVLTGDDVSSLAWVGVALGLLAIGLVSSSDDRSSAPATTAVVAESVLAGVAFGAMLILFAETDPASLPWPVVADGFSP